MAALVTGNAWAQTHKVTGPDGKLCVEFNMNNGKASYNVKYDGEQMLDDSPLGLTATLGDLSQNLTVTKAVMTTRHDKYSLKNIKQSEVDVESNVMRIGMKNDRNQQMDVVFCVSNNDIAFRYEVPTQPDKEHGKKMSIRVTKEATGFDLPHETTTFLCPQSKPMVAWMGSKPSYEEEYKFDAPLDLASDFGEGYTFPCLFKVGEKGWVLISETGVDSRYCASHLTDVSGDGLFNIAFPMEGENNGNGTVEPAFALPGVTPWRTITVGKTLKPIVETTVPWNYVEPRYQTEHDYKYGKSSWSWIVWQDDPTSWDNQIAYINLASELGYPYCLVDASWDTTIGYERMEKLAEYARSKNVDLFLWYSSSGYWNDIQQTPLNRMDNPIVRKQTMRWMQKIGIKGIKVDFFAGDKQETMRLYEAILSDADDCGIMVIFHGCTLPRGWERMYPNYVGSEAVLASENIVFQQHFADEEPRITAFHPFCRNTVGCMEFGGSFMNRHIHRGNKGGTTRRSTDAHEMAQAILFQNPIQNFALAPENLKNEKNKDLAPNEPGAAAPEVSINFMKEVPTSWDETQFIDGYPGQYCVLARRSGSTWYIAGNNATSTTKQLTLSLPMLKKGDTVTLYSDNLKDGEPQKTQLKITNPEKVKVPVLTNGGFVIVK